MLCRRWAAPGWLGGLTLVLFLFALGVTAAKLRAEHVAAPVLDPDRTTYRLTAFVVDNISP